MTPWAQTQPGRPLPNGQVENLQGKFQDKGLNVRWFGNRWEARRKVEAGRQGASRSSRIPVWGIRPEEFAAGAPVPPAFPPTLAGVLQTRVKGVKDSTNRVAASTQI